MFSWGLIIGIGKLETVWDVVKIVWRYGMFGGVLCAVVMTVGWVVTLVVMIAVLLYE